MFRKNKQEFPTLMTPPVVQGWWFWGAVGVSIGIWGGIIYGVSYFF